MPKPSQGALIPRAVQQRRELLAVLAEARSATQQLRKQSDTPMSARQTVVGTRLHELWWKATRLCGDLASESRDDPDLVFVTQAVALALDDLKALVAELLGLTE